MFTKPIRVRSWSRQSYVAFQSRTRLTVFVRRPRPRLNASIGSVQSISTKQASGPIEGNYDQRSGTAASMMPVHCGRKDSVGQVRAVRGSLSEAQRIMTSLLKEFAGPYCEPG